jgi:hypothetical protein
LRGRLKCLPSKCKALSSNPSSDKKYKKIKDETGSEELSKFLQE